MYDILYVPCDNFTNTMFKRQLRKYVEIIILNNANKGRLLYSDMYMIVVENTLSYI